MRKSTFRPRYRRVTCSKRSREPEAREWHSNCKYIKVSLRGLHLNGTPKWQHYRCEPKVNQYLALSHSNSLYLTSILDYTSLVIMRLDGYTFYPVLIIGAGESGIAMGRQLQQKLGFHDFRIFDRQSGIGGLLRSCLIPQCEANLVRNVVDQSISRSSKFH